MSHLRSIIFLFRSSISFHLLLFMFYLGTPSRAPSTTLQHLSSFCLLESSYFPVRLTSPIMAGLDPLSVSGMGHALRKAFIHGGSSHLHEHSSSRDAQASPCQPSRVMRTLPGSSGRTVQVLWKASARIIRVFRRLAVVLDCVGVVGGQRRHCSPSTVQRCKKSLQVGSRPPIQQMITMG